MTLVVRSIAFPGDGSAVIEWMDDERDLKANGLVLNHVAMLPAEEYEDEIDAIYDPAKAAVESLMIDSDRLGPLLNPAPDDDDEDDEQ